MESAQPEEPTRLKYVGLPGSGLGRYIRTKRKAAGLSQDDLAERIPFTQPAISAWESGLKVPTARAIAALATALDGATVEEMVSLAAEEPVA